MAYVLGIAGGSGAGKTTLARKIVEAFGEGNCIVLSQDHYYIDQSAKFDGDGGSVNFDHPSSVDFSLLAEHMNTLKQDISVKVPIYDFATHKRQKKTNTLKSAPVVIVEGTLLLSQEKTRKECQYKIFINVPEHVRFERRLKRDVQERGRTPEGVRKQFDNQVKPMHDQFVQPSKIFADYVVSNDDYDSCIKKLRQIIKI